MTNVLSAMDRRKKAVECEGVARRTCDDDLKDTYRDLAVQWRELAKTMDKLHNEQPPMRRRLCR